MTSPRVLRSLVVSSLATGLILATAHGALAAPQKHLFTPIPVLAAGNPAIWGSWPSATAPVLAAPYPSKGRPAPNPSPTSSRGGSYFVSPNGRDTGTCGQSNPCASFQYATGLTHAGDTVMVESGTYGPQVITVNGTAASPITVEGTGVTLTRPAGASNAMQNTVLLRVQNSSYVTVEGFTVVGMKGRADLNPADTTPLYGEVDVSGAMGAGAGIVLQHLTVEHANYTCIKQEDDEQYETIQYNSLNDCGAPGNTQEHGIYLSGGHNIVAGNVVNGTSGYGIHSYQTSAVPVSNETITANVVRNTGCAGIYSYEGPSTIARNVLSGSPIGIEV